MKRIAIYTHAACLQHDTGPDHAECAARLRAVTDTLHRLPGLEWHDAPRAARGQLARVHQDLLLRRILDTCPDELIELDPDTLLSPDSAQAALRAAGAGVAAVDAVIHGEFHAAFCAVRPPGHHASGDTAMGFCLFNNIAIAAAHALERHGLSRVSIIDFDVHHGNGTQAIFEHEPRVQYVSTHQSPLFPGTGAPGECGVGNLFNAPLPRGADSAAFRHIWQQQLLPEIDAFAPELMLISAGFDAHWRDPLAQLRLDSEDFAWLTGASSPPWKAAMTSPHWLSAHRRMCWGCRGRGEFRAYHTALTREGFVVMMNNRKAELIHRNREAFTDGSFTEQVIWRVPQPVVPCLHPYKYRLVYIVDGVRVVGYDNERGKGDHRHFGEKQSAYVFRGVNTLMADFVADITRWNNGYRHS